MLFVVICIMNLLITAATAMEIQPLLNHLEEEWEKQGNNSYRSGRMNIDILISGIGGLFTVYHLTRYLQHRPCSAALQAGIAGSFNMTFELGEVVLVEREYLADLGIEDKETFTDLFDHKFMDPNEFPFQHGALINDFSHLYNIAGLEKAVGVSVNRASGNLRSIAQLEQKYHPDIESMEGGAFHYVCLQEKIPFWQMRAISNYVEVRDKSKWKMPFAIENLNIKLVTFLKDLLKKYG